MRRDRRARRAHRASGPGLLVPVALLLFGCQAPFIGGPSLTLLSSIPNDSRFEPVGPRIEEEACAWAVLLFGGGNFTHHEALVDRALERANADVLLDAELENTAVSYILGARNCTVVRGQPARLVGGESI